MRFPSRLMIASTSMFSRPCGTWPAKIICLKSMLKVWKTRRPTRRTNGAKRSALVLSSVKLP